jgi:hypothetical protein
LKLFTATLIFILLSFYSWAQVKWINVDSLYQPLPASVHVYFTQQPIDSAPFRAFYVIADISDRKLDFIADTSRDRRLTPSAFFDRNNQALLVVNCTFFSFETNRNLNTVISNGKLVSYNIHTVNGRGKDTFTYRHPFGSAIGISKKRKADIAWLYTDSSLKKAYAWISGLKIPLPDSSRKLDLVWMAKSKNRQQSPFTKWKMKTAVGGGPVLITDGEIRITNNEEIKFAGKAINDKHPRTAMGYTKDNKLIILVIEGRNKLASGASLTQEAQLLKELGCWEAMNMDGGGSSCMLVNGKATITVSDATGQRPVPAAFIIKKRK